MPAYEAVRRRYGFDLPEAYRALEGAGHFAPQATDYLSFYDCEWLPPQQIADFKFNPWEIASDGGFAPFAMSGAHEPYCWPAILTGVRVGIAWRELWALGESACSPMTRPAMCATPIAT
jgi:hypothetical protein